MNLYNLPIKLGQEFRNNTIRNFRDLLYEVNEGKRVMYRHKNEDKQAHLATQIYHDGHSVGNFIDVFRNRLKAQIIGANGDGIAELTDARVSVDGTRFDLASERLDYDFKNMADQIEENYKNVNNIVKRIRNVNDFGGDPTGVKDSTNAFVKAFENGFTHVHMTEGTYKVNGLKLPSNTILSGEGKGVTTIRMADEAPQENCVVTNRDIDGTATNIVIKDMTINGNKFRQDGALKPAGGSRSSNLRFAGVTNGYAYNIESVDALLHGIDVTYASEDYFYEGDGVRVNEQLESKFIHIDNCETTGFGDDGITTHHSRHLNITNNYSHHPTMKGEFGGGNNNGIEIDDGTQFTMLNGNTTKHNHAGIEIKAHGTTSAPSAIFVNNHLSIEDIRSYNVRHIGHHRAATDKKSKTAKDVVLNNVTAVTPYANKVYENVAPRALVIAAYDGVLVNNLTCVGDGRFTSNQPVAVVQFMAQNVVINNVNITGFKNASEDLKVYGGGNRGKNIKFSNVNIHNSSVNRGIAGGAGVEGFGIYNANLTGTGKGNGVELYNNLAELIGINAVNYTNAALITEKKYEVAPTVVKGGLSAGSTGGGAINERSVYLASSGYSFAHDKNTWLLGSNSYSHSYGSRSGIMNSSSSETLKDGFAQTIMNSRSVKSLGNYHIQAGYGDTDTPSASNTKIDIHTTTGNVRTAGYLKSGQDIGDIGEYFESEDGNEIENGFIVSMNGRYIRKAQRGDKPIGVVSGTAGLVMGDQLFHHKSKFKKDKFGVTLTKLVENTFIDDDGIEKTETMEQPIINDDYDGSEEEGYQSRSERPEWSVVGLTGQIYTRIDNTVEVNDAISAMNGIGTKDNENGYWHVEEITTPYDKQSGYGVAVVLVK